MSILNTLLADIDFNIIERAKEQGLPHAENISQTADGVGVVAGIIGGFLRVATLIAALLLLFNLVYAGIEWISAGGDSSKIEKAKTRITQSIVGVIILAASVAIFVTINTLIGGPIDIIGGRGGSGGGGGSPPPGVTLGRCACINDRGNAPVGAISIFDGVCRRCTETGWVEVPEMSTRDCSAQIRCY